MASSLQHHPVPESLDEIQPQGRLELLVGETELARLAQDVVLGFSVPPFKLPCSHLFDRIGCLLFEQLGSLPDYHIERAETELLADTLGATLDACGEEIELVEVGAGRGTATRLLIDALLHRQDRLHLVAVDPSPSVLRAKSEALLDEYPQLRVTAITADHHDAMRRLPHAEATRLFAWLGSHIGTHVRCEAAAWLHEVRNAMAPWDRVLAGIDLRKPEPALLRAYNDTAGVMAQFNLSLLARLNHELAADFDLSTFRYLPRYERVFGRIEMHLVSSIRQEVQIGALGLTVHFNRGDTIHTGNHYQYSPAEIAELAAAGSLALEHHWQDAGERYSLNLLAPL